MREELGSDFDESLLADYQADNQEAHKAIGARNATVKAHLKWLRITNEYKKVH